MYNAENSTENGFSMLTFEDYEKEFKTLPTIIHSMNQFISSYERLEPDAHMGDDGKYRFRRFGRFMYSQEMNILTALPAGKFYQSKEVNQLNGGVIREFAPIESSIEQNNFLEQIIRVNFNRISDRENYKNWNIYVHQIRIIAKKCSSGLPAPEGIHRDGHYYVAQVFISRENVKGGISYLFNQDKKPLLAVTLCNILDTILLNDQMLYHDVSPIKALNHDTLGKRDMLLIDFNPITRENSDD